MAVDVSKIPNNNKFDPVRQAILDLQGEISSGVAGVASINNVSGAVTLTGLSPITVSSSTSTSQITIGINQSLLSITESQISDLGSYIELTDLSITTSATPSGGGALSYDDTTGVFTFTPADAGTGLTLQQVTANGNSTTYGISTGNISVQPAGTGSGVVTIQANSVGDARVDLTPGSTAGDGVIRTTIERGISFEPFNTEKVFIASDGNMNVYEKLAVGKTTAAASYHLEVDGTALAHNFITSMTASGTTYTGTFSQYYNALQIRTVTGGTISLGGSGPLSVQNNVAIKDGDLDVNGDVTADFFIGDGSLLTNITGANQDLQDVTDNGNTTTQPITIADNAASFTALTLETSDSSYVKQDFKTDSIAATTAFLIAYGSANPQDGAFAIKNNASHTTTNGTAGDIWFQAGGLERLRIKGSDGTVTINNDLDVAGTTTTNDIIVDFNASGLSHGIIFKGVSTDAGDVGIRANGEAFEIYEPEQSNKVWLSIADDPEGNGIAAQLNSPSGFTPILTNYNKGSYVTKAYIDGLNVDADTLDSLDSTAFLRSNTADTFTGGTLTISSTAPILDFVDTNSFTDANDRFRIRAAGDVGQIRWYDSSAATDTVLTTFYPNGNVSIAGELSLGGAVINMANDDGFVYDDANNVMKVKYDGNQYDILTAANHTSFTDSKYLRSDQDDTTTGTLTIQKGLLDATFLNLLNQNTSGDISQQRSFIDFTYVDSNTNETPQVRIGAEVGQNGDADSQIKEGSGAFVVYTNNADTDAGIAGASLAERFRVDYLGRVGINNNSPFAKLQVTGAAQANGHYDDFATTIIEDAECRFQLVGTNDGNDASTILLTNVQSSTDNRHWVIGHRGPSRSNRFEIGYVTSTTGGNIGTGGFADFVIDTSGRVGINIDTPSEQFEVNGDVRIYGSGSTIGGATVGNASLLIGSPTSGIGIDDNEIHSTGAMYIGTNSSNLVLRPADAVLINTTTTTGAAKLLVNGFLSTGSSAVAQFKGFIRAEGQLFLHHDSNNSNAARILYDGTNGLSFTTEGTGSNNFGIATTVPEELLHVNGTIKAEGTIKIDDGATGNPYLALYQSGTEKAYFQYVDSGDNLVIQSDGAISLRTGSSSKLHIPLSGEVGIGCDDPQTLLEIRGNAPFLTISNFQENDGGIYFNDYQAGANPATSAQAASIKWSSSDNKMRICNNDANNLAIGIDMEGDVGIGTDSPTGKFNSYISAARQLTHNGNGGDLSIISDNNSAPVMYVKGTGSADLLNVYANTVEVFNIASSGNLSVYSATNGAGAKINFSDNRPTVTQFGTMEYTHLNTQSYGQGEAFKFYGSETSMAFHVAGIGLFTGDITAFYSDMRLKTKLGDIENPIGKLQALNGFYYEPNEVAESYGYKKERRLGLSAQEVKEVFPEAVSDAAIGDGYMSVDYAKLVPVLVEAIKEQQKQIDELKARLDA